MNCVIADAIARHTDDHVDTRLRDLAQDTADHAVRMDASKIMRMVQLASAFEKYKDEVLSGTEYLQSFFDGWSSYDFYAMDENIATYSRQLIFDYEKTVYNRELEILRGDA